jgi:hypothetical protein
MNTAGRNARCGAAWKNDDGSIYVKLDLFISLQQMGDLQIRLFPVTDRPPVRPAQPGSPPIPEDDIPF